MFEVLDGVLKGFHFGIERANRLRYGSVGAFRPATPGVECGKQFCFDALELKADPLLVLVS